MENNASAAGPEKPSFYALLPALLLGAGILASFLPGVPGDKTVLPLEVFADLFIVFFAFRYTDAGRRWWRAGALALLGGDSLYMGAHLFPPFPIWAIMLQETCYTLARFFMALYLYAHLPPLRTLRPAEKWLLVLLCLGMTWFSTFYLVIPLIASGAFPVFFSVNGVFNRLAESAVFPPAILLGMKARTRHWLLLTHGITLVSISSIAIGYYMVNNATFEGVPTQEYGWLFGLFLILAAQAYSPRRTETFAPWNGARVRLAWLALVFNLVLLGGMYLAGAFTIGGVYQFASVLFVLFAVWLASNLISFRIAEDINLMIDGVGAAGDGPPYRVDIHEAGRFADKLEKAYATIRSQARLSALSSVAAQVAHDIRSPLAALEAALRGIGDLPPEKLGLVRAAAGRISGIADDLLGKKRGVGRLPLAGLIAPVIEEKRLQYGGRGGLEIVCSIPEEARALSASADPVEFSRVISNLVNNAAEAIEGAGRVTVALARDGGSAAVTVSDDGKGIPPEVLRRLEESGGTHGKAGGSGLGLAHARAAAESWGGSLEISSEPGRGTAVKLRLPLAGGGPGPREALLLDDDDLVIMTWRAAAKAAGASLRAFKDPDEFISAAAGAPAGTPLYIDSDLGGGLSGEEIAAGLREKGFTDITMATGHGPERFRRLPWLKVSGKEPPWERGDVPGGGRPA